MLARQAGYQVLEINASDDRTGRVVEERIRNALDSQALTTGAASSGKGKAKAHEEGRNRPTCVVVDEIDGAAGGGEAVRPAAFAMLSSSRSMLLLLQSFVKTLVKLITEGSTLRKPSSKLPTGSPITSGWIASCILFFRSGREGQR